MKPIRNVLMAGLLASGALVAAAAGISMATAADDTTAAASTTTPPPPPGPHGWRHHGGPGHLYAKLGLSAAQQASIKSIMTAAQPQMQSLHQQMRANALKLRQTQPNDPNYSSIVGQTSQTHGSLAAQAVTQREEIRAQVFKVLTPAQQTQLATLEAQREAAMEARMKAHPPGSWGGPHGPGPHGPDDMPPPAAD